MPHFIIDCSETLLDQKSPEDIMMNVYKGAESSGLFAVSGVGGIKVRINPYAHYITVGNRKDFIHVFAHIMEGRTVKQKQELSKKIVSELKIMFPDVPIISMNITDFEKATYCNKSMVN